MTPVETTLVAGIEIPSTSPFFLTVVGLHILVGPICIITGAIAMLSPTRSGRHPTFGTIYYWSLAAVFVSASTLTVVRWAEDYHLFILRALAFASAFFGRAARRQRWAGWVGLENQEKRFVAWRTLSAAAIPTVTSVRARPIEKHATSVAPSANCLS